MFKKKSLNVTEYLSGLTKDNIEEVAATLEKTPAMILQCVNILETWNSRMTNLCSSIFEVLIIILFLLMKSNKNYLNAKIHILFINSIIIVFS